VPTQQECLGCGSLFPKNQLKRGRCPSCLAAQTSGYDQAKRTRRPYSEAERRRRHATVAAHVAIHGWWCPGWGADHPPHPSSDLTAHHVDAYGRTGSESGPLAVLCRSYNSTLGAR
jgi:hypothetical protein